jgi:hypothetical protein
MPQYPISRIVLVLSGLLCLVAGAQAQTMNTIIDDSPPAILYLNSQTDSLIHLDATHDNTIVARTIPICPFQTHLDGHWNSNRLGSDGKVYFGSSSHAPSTGAKFFQYDPSTAQVHLLGDVNTICGEDPNIWRPQGKMHSQMYEDNGYMYFTTFYGYENKTYPGGHVIRYKMGSYEAGAAVFKDMGIPNPGGFIYTAFSIDHLLHRAYVNSSGNIYHYDLTLPDTATFTATYRGNTGGVWNNCFYQLDDSQGNLWTSACYTNGSLFLVPPSGSMVQYSNVFPPISRPDNLVVDSSYQVYRYVGWGEKYGTDGFIFTMAGDAFIWKLDANEARLGHWGTNQAFKKIARVGDTGGDTGLIGDTVYWWKSARVWNSYCQYLGTNDPFGPQTDSAWHYYTSDSKAKDNHLLSISLIDPRLSAPGYDPNVQDPNLVKDWGRVVDQDGRTPYRAENMSGDATHLYMEGDWRNLATDPNNWHTLKALYLNADQGYIQLWRGQFFAIIPLTRGNQAPVVSAGNPQTITLPAAATLAGTVSDDGLPSGAAVTSTWSVTSGPGSVTFANASLPATTATFSTAGTYVLRLTASDTALSSYKEVQITANPFDGTPTANAGPAVKVMIPNPLTLAGTISDDGLPNPPGVCTAAWSKVSGPANVTFSNPNAASTTAAFTVAGTYVLRLTASDSQLSATGDVTATVLTPGDFNGDGKVDGVDFLTWQSHYPTASGATPEGGDGNADGKVDGVDFLIWQSGYAG